MGWLLYAIYTHHWELMKSVHSHSSLPILFFVMKVTVWHFVNDSHKYDCTCYCLTFKLLLWIFLSNFIDMYLSSDILLSPWISRSFGNLLRMIIYHHWVNCWNCIVMETIIRSCKMNDLTLWECLAIDKPHNPHLLVKLKQWWIRLYHLGLRGNIAPWESLFQIYILQRGNFKMKWSLLSQDCCSLKEDTVDFSF